MEIVSLIQEEDCSKPSDLPFADDGSVGGYFRPGEAFVCGGYVAGRACFSYFAENDLWVSSAFGLDHRRKFATSADSGRNFVVLGGEQIPATETSERLDYDGDGSFYSRPEIPALIHPCACSVNATHFFIAGSSTAYLIRVDDDGDAQQLPPLPNDRELFSCGLTNQGSEIVVTGGGPAFNTTDIFSLVDMSWRTGPVLPSPLRLAASVPYGDTFLVVGGQQGDDGMSVDTIFQYDPEGPSWIEREERLALARDSHVAIPLPDDGTDYCRAT